MKIEAVRKAAMALPGTTEEPHHQFSSFRVNGKIYVTVPPDEEHIHVFVTEAEREVALATNPGFIEKLLWGGKVVGVRVALAKAVPSAVKALVAQAHRFKSAPPPSKSSKRQGATTSVAKNAA
jgi:hypothetical protein